MQSLSRSTKEASTQKNIVYRRRAAGAAIFAAHFVMLWFLSWESPAAEYGERASGRAAAVSSPPNAGPEAELPHAVVTTFLARHAPASPFALRLTRLDLTAPEGFETVAASAAPSMGPIEADTGRLLAVVPAADVLVLDVRLTVPTVGGRGAHAHQQRAAAIEALRSQVGSHERAFCTAVRGAIDRLARWRRVVIVPASEDLQLEDDWTRYHPRCHDGPDPLLHAEAVVAEATRRGRMPLVVSTPLPAMWNVMLSSERAAVLHGDVVVLQHPLNVHTIDRIMAALSPVAKQPLLYVGTGCGAPERWAVAGALWLCLDPKDTLGIVVDPARRLARMP